MAPVATAYPDRSSRGCVHRRFDLRADAAQFPIQRLRCAREEIGPGRAGAPRRRVLPTAVWPVARTAIVLAGSPLACIRTDGHTSRHERPKPSCPYRIGGCPHKNGGWAVLYTISRTNSPANSPANPPGSRGHQGSPGSPGSTAIRGGSSSKLLDLECAATSQPCRLVSSDWRMITTLPV